MARYWPCSAETVIGGRPLAAEFERAWESWGLGFRRLDCACKSILPAWWRCPVVGEAILKGSGVGSEVGDVCVVENRGEDVCVLDVGKRMKRK